MGAPQIIKPNNPANAEAVPQGARKRIPMSTPTLKLEVPLIDGWHLHWIKTSNIPRALQAGYEFVDSREVPINQRNYATSGDISGNQSLGSQVAVAAGTDAQGHPEQLVLMKLPEELWIDDRRNIDHRNASILQGIFRGERIIGEENDAPEDMGTRYVRKDRLQAALFQRPAKKVQS
jgi:hypothetical protein